MNTWITIAISGCSLFIGFVTGFSAIRRNNKKDITDVASQTATIICKLETIGNDVREIKADIASVKNTVQKHSEKIVKLEQQIYELNRIVLGEN